MEPAAEEGPDVNDPCTIMNEASTAVHDRRLHHVCSQREVPPTGRLCSSRATRGLVPLTMEREEAFHGRRHAAGVGHLRVLAGFRVPAGVAKRRIVCGTKYIAADE